MFRGRYEHTIDAKGRTSLPARYRDVLASMGERRIIVSGAVECDVDDSGRVLVPPTLREYAALKKDVLWAGSGKYAELWDAEQWKRAFDATDDEREQIGARLAELGL